MPETLVLLSGGLDQQAANVAAPKGTLRDCLNFEVGTQAGYSRIGGHMPHDGTVMGPNVSDFLYFAVQLSGWNSIDFEYAEEVELDIIGDFVGTQQTTVNCIGWVQPGASNGVLIMAFTPAKYADAFYLAGCAVVQAVGLTSGATITSMGSSLRKASDGLLTPQNYGAYRSNVETKHVAAIAPVPGELEACCDAAFTYKDNDYAIHDCAAIFFRDGELGDACEGHIIKAGTDQVGIILSITTTSGDWDAGTAEGYVILYDRVPGMAFPADGTTLNLWSANGITDLGAWAVYDGVSDRSTLRSKTRALLYSATLQRSGETKATTPWERRRLSRELGYTQIGATNPLGFGPQGDADYSIYEYSRLGLFDQNSQLDPVTTAYKFCNTVAQAATAWTNLANIQAQDGAVATTPNVNGYSTWMRATNFDFSEIPAGSVITGLEVVIRRRATTSATSSRDWSVRLVVPDGNGGVVLQAEKSNRDTTYPLVLTDATYGGATDNWGVQLSRDMLNDALFGIHFEAKRTAADVISVDDIKVRATYIPATRLVYIRNATAAAPTDIEARVVHYTRDSGDATTADQVGVLTLWIGENEYDGTSAGKSRRIGPGEEIRTASGGGGSLLALTTGEDVPTSLPCGAALEAEDARWEIKLANYYADPDAQMVFAVNGTEYAFAYDEQYSVRIRSGRRQDLDKPRHIAHHLNFVHLGFESGDMLNSGVFRPLTFDAFLGTMVRNVGEPITGLDTLNGQTLGVWTNRAVRGYQGNSPLNYVPIVISPAIGAHEYTVANLAGVPMWASARGIESISTVSAYGDFQTDPLSFAATPWLQDRLQFDSRVGLIDKRPVLGYAVRNKRQYRLPFRDGYQFTLTLFGIEDVPMCTIQRLERGDAAEPYNRAPVRHVFAGVREDGSEAILCCFDRQNPLITGNETNDGAYPYLSVLDAGRTFAGNEIPAYVEINPIYGSIPSQEQKWQSAFLWSNAMPLTGYTLYAKYTHDEPFPPLGQGVVGTVQPAGTVLYLPFPSYAASFNVGRSGPFIRMRYDVNTSGALEAPRLTHLTLTTADPLNMKRT